MTNESDSRVIFTDRSRIADAERCMRLRYWGYEHDGRGLEKGGEWLDQLMGTAIHIGTQYLLSGKSVEEAMGYAKEVMLAARRQGPIEVFRPSGDQAADFEEGMTLVEALVRGWAVVRLPQLLDAYDILLIEKEMSKRFESRGRTIELLVRADVVVKRKSDGAVFVRNMKKVSRVDDKWRTKWQLDMSSFSEASVVEEYLGQPVTGTIYEGFVAGWREAYPKGSTNVHWTSPLIRPWKREGQPPMSEDEWYSQYEWHCYGPHTMGNGKKCPGDKDHKLSGVHKADVREYPGGVAAWIARLAQTDRALLDEQFVELTPIIRSPFEVERWKRQKLPIETTIRERRDALQEEGNLQDNAYLLDTWFPMSTSDGNCVWPVKCTFYDICHGVALDDLEGNGFKARDPNHPKEFGDE